MALDVHVPRFHDISPRLIMANIPVEEISGLNSQCVSHRARLDLMVRFVHVWRFYDISPRLIMANIPSEEISRLNSQCV